MSLFSIGAISCMAVPLPAPNVYPWLYIIRFACAIFYVGVTSHPFINDFVMRESRGRALALQFFGYILGEIFNVVVVVKLI